MADTKRAKGDGRAEARRLADLVQRAVDEGAKSVEEIHRSVASMPLDVLERLDLFEKTTKDVRRIQEASIGAIYDLIHKVNREVANLARELLERPETRKPAGTKPVAAAKPAAAKPAPAKRARSRAASAHPR